MIDLHSHILFGLDDGPGDLDASLALARAAVASGTREMVATPHLDAHWGVDPGAIAPRAEQVRAALERDGIGLRLHTGAEIALDRFLELDDATLASLRLGGGPYLLIESPLTLAAGSVELAVRAVMRRGHRVLLAHPERCPAFQRRPDTLAALVEQGALCQLTAESLTGRFGREVRAFSIRLLREGLVHNLASDAHDERRRPPGLGAGLREAERDLPGVSVQREWLTRDAPRAVLEGSELPPRPAIPEPPRRRFRLLG